MEYKDPLLVRSVSVHYIGQLVECRPLFIRAHLINFNARIAKSVLQLFVPLFVVFENAINIVLSHLPHTVVYFITLVDGQDVGGMGFM